MKPTLAIALVASALAGCASAPDAPAGRSAPATPLDDLNLVRASIPAPLQAAQKQPYAQPPDQSCAALNAQVRELDELLGADLDAPITATNPSLLERASDAAAGAVRGTVEGVVPYRGWIRKLSGAERYSKEVAASITAGSIRRAFLKGIRATRGC